MAITLDGSGTIAGLSAGGLPDGAVTADDLATGAAIGNLADGSVTAAKLASTLDLSGKTVTLPAGTGGKMLQVVSTTKTDRWSQASVTANGGYSNEISGFTVSITPSSTSSKILIMVNMSAGATPAYCLPILRRDSSDLIVGDTGLTYRATSGLSVYDGANLHYLDAPSTTSSVTYSIRFINTYTSNYYVGINDGLGTNGTGIDTTVTSTITAMEIAG